MIAAQWFSTISGLLSVLLVAALRPAGPYPILFLHGEQGSGKSTQARVLRALVDPNSAPLCLSPKEAHDLALAAHNGWVIALDNLSRLPGWLSDALCRLSTGGGFATRTLFENEEETIFDAQRPVLVTGIEDLASRGDLLDRALVVQLPVIPPSRRRTEAEFWREFDEERPWLVGALAEAAATAWRGLATVRPPELPRLADFAQWAAAAEPALGCAPGTFERLYARHNEAISLFALESSAIAVPIFEIARGGPWRGTASGLLEALDQKAVASDAPPARLAKRPGAVLGAVATHRPQPARVRHIGRVHSRRTRGTTPDRVTARGIRGRVVGKGLGEALGRQLAAECDAIENCKLKISNCKLSEERAEEEPTRPHQPAGTQVD